MQRKKPRPFGRRGAGLTLHLSRAARYERSHGRSCRGCRRPYRSEPTLSIRPRPYYARLISIVLVLKYEVGLGSLTHIEALPLDVRFTPESRHWLNASGCPLWVNNGHSVILNECPLYP